MVTGIFPDYEELSTLVLFSLYDYLLEIFSTKEKCFTAFYLLGIKS